MDLRRFRGIPDLGNRAIDMIHERIAATGCLPNLYRKHVYENTGLIQEDYVFGVLPTARARLVDSGVRARCTP
jgi:hypothetical protein